MNLFLKTELDYQTQSLALYYYLKAKVKEIKRNIKHLRAKLEEETDIKAVPYDKITRGTSVTFVNASALSPTKLKLLEKEAELQKNEEMLELLNKQHKYEEAYKQLKRKDQEFIYALFFKGLSVKEIAEEFKMNEKYVYRKIKIIIKVMTGVEEDD